MKNKIDTRALSDSSDYIVLGQEPDNSDPGGFDPAQAFSGSLAQVSMWDKVLSPEEVHSLASCRNSSAHQPGNVISWEDQLAWTAHNVLFSQEDQVCQGKSAEHSYIGSYETVSLTSALDTCNNMGGVLPSELLTDSASLSDYQVINQYYNESVASLCSQLHTFWTGLLITGMFIN